MFLGIKTDSPVAEFYLYKSANEKAEYIWQADRSLALHLLEELETFLKKNGAEFSDLKGLYIYKGPGSFTGLRIGITVLNTMAYSLSIPIVGTMGSNWQLLATDSLMKGENHKIVIPHYGAEARITKPKK